MNFIPLEKQEQLDSIKNAQGYNIIFKHNTTCPISKSVRATFEQEADEIPEVKEVYFLDLLKYRDVSDAVSQTFHIEHQSPQLLLIKDGQCIYDEALYNISADRVAEAID